MNREQLNIYITRRKDRVGSWRKFADEIGTDHRNLHHVVQGHRKPDEAMLQALGVVETTKESYGFTKKKIGGSK